MRNRTGYPKFLEPIPGFFAILLVLAACHPINLPSSETMSPTYSSTEIIYLQVNQTATSEAPGTNDSLWSITTHRVEGDQVRVMIIDQDGYLLAGGQGGLVRWNIVNKTPEILSIIPESEVVPVVALMETKGGILWVGTFGDGIYRIDQGTYEFINSEDGLPSNYISSLTQSGDGIVWVDTSPYTPYYRHSEDGRLANFDGQKWQIMNGGGFYKLSSSSDGSLWGLADWAENNKLATYLGNYQNGEWSMEEIAGEIITEFEIAPDGIPWVATHNGIYYLNDSGWNRIDTPWAGKTEASVTTMAISKEGVAWFGLSYDPRTSTDKCGVRIDGFVELGVYRYDGKKWDHFTTIDGLVDNKVCKILLSQDGTVWVGTFDKGISRYNGKTWETYSVSQKSN